MNTHLFSKTRKILAMLLAVGLLTSFLVLVFSAPPVLASQETAPRIPPVYTFKLEVPILEKYGIPGEVVSYEFYLTNAGNVPDIYTVSYKSVWDVKTSITIGPLKPGEQVKDEILVLIPVKIDFGEGNQALIQFSSNGKPAVFEIVELKTTAVNWP